MVPNPRPLDQYLWESLLGIRLPSERWVEFKGVKLHLYLQLLYISSIIAWAPPPVKLVATLDSHRSMNPTIFESSPNHPSSPHPWKNCFPRNWSLVPKRLRTTASFHCLRFRFVSSIQGALLCFSYCGCWMTNPSADATPLAAGSTAGSQTQLIETTLTLTSHQVKMLIWNWESQFLGRFIRSLGSPRRRKRSGALEVELGIWNSGKDRHLPSTFLSLSLIKRFFL